MNTEDLKRVLEEQARTAKGQADLTHARCFATVSLMSSESKCVEEVIAKIEAHCMIMQALQRAIRDEHMTQKYKR